MYSMRNSFFALCYISSQIVIFRNRSYDYTVHVRIFFHITLIIRTFVTLHVFRLRYFLCDQLSSQETGTRNIVTGKRYRGCLKKEQFKKTSFFGYILRFLVHHFSSIDVQRRSRCIELTRKYHYIYNIIIYYRSL